MVIVEKKHQSFLSQWLNSHFKLWAIAVLAIILIAGYWKIIGPQLRELGPGGRFDVAARQNTIKNQEQYLGDLQALANDLAAFKQENLTKLTQILPVAKETPLIFAQLEAIAKDSGLQLSNIQISEAVPAKVKKTAAVQPTAPADGQSLALKKLNINISLSGGNYSALVDFLGDLEKNWRLMDVASVAFDSAGDAYSLNLVTYYLQ